MKRLLLASAALAIVGVPGAGAADLPVAPAPVAAPVSPWQVEFGTRYWYSTGKSSKDLYSNVNPNVMVSRLTYGDTTGHSGELFFRADHQPTGFFTKGFVGAGSITNGKMNDEDFAPAAVPTYSNTLQETHNGSLSYATIDVGWAFWDTLAAARPLTTKAARSVDDYDGLLNIGARIGVFVGFNYWNEFAKTYGCSQQAGGGVCVPSPVTTGNYTLGQDNTWKSFRLGFNGEVAMGPSWMLVVDAAYIWTDLSGYDHHQLRPDINPLHETGTGHGVQLEALVKYHVTDNFDIGVGARYWKVFSDGSVTFPGAVTSSPERWDAQRAGAFVQASSRFDAVNTSNTIAKISQAPARSIWNGAYGGFSVGGAFSGSSNASFTGVNAFSQGLINAGLIPATLSVNNDGFLAGGQAGFNWSRNQWLLGVETDLSYASIKGANSYSAVPGFEILNTTVDRDLTWLGTVRGRVGFLATPSTLLYGTGGLAAGETTLHVETTDALVGLFTDSGARTVSKVSVGYTVGAGVEQAFNKWASVKIEYLYVDLGNLDVGPVVVNASQDNVSIRNTTNIIRGGMNFRF